MRFFTLSLFAVTAFAQQVPLKFEVSTVKPNASNDNRVMLQNQLGGRFAATGVALKLLMTEAYEVRDFQITGGPGWVNTDRWDIVAKTEGVTDRLPLEKLRPMLKVLIEDRFQLKVHRETKEMPVYALTVAKGGSKLQANSGEPGPMLRMGRGELIGKKVAMPMILQVLSQQLRRPVLDKTDLKGEYDFTLTWTPEPGAGAGPGPPGGPGPDAAPPVDLSGPSIFTAIQEQLGLRLESIKGPADVVVIDSVEKPTDN
jgi:uncharacterized protein (TIGR03435 family)